MNTKAIIVSWLAAAAGTTAQASYNFTNFAGNPGGTGNADGTGPAARFNYPSGIAADNLGNVFVADTQNHTIRKVTLAGVTTTIAGSPGQVGSANGAGGSARFDVPTGIAVDLSGNLYVADYGNSTIRKLVPSGGGYTVSTLAGIPGVTGLINGSTAKATFSSPYGLAVDTQGNVYVADTGNAVVRKITPAGTVSTLISNSYVITTNGNFGYTNKFFETPMGIAVDTFGNIYVSDYSGMNICKFTPGGVVIPGGYGEDGVAIGCVYNSTGLAVDQYGEIFVSGKDSDYIKELYPDDSDYDSENYGRDYLYYPGGVAVDVFGNVYVADTYDQVIWQITADEDNMFILAGEEGDSGSDNGTGIDASFDNPEGLAIDTLSNIYVADTDNSAIRLISTNGTVSYWAGDGQGFENGAGPEGALDNPRGVAVDAAGNVYVADAGNGRVLEFSTQGRVSTFDSDFSDPFGLAFDSSGNLYVADSWSNFAIDEVTPEGTQTELYYADQELEGIAVDGAGNVYYSTYNNGNIYKLSTTNKNPTVYQTNNANGVALSHPSGLTFDGSGNLYVADIEGNRIVIITPTGFATTFAGATNGSSGYSNSVGTNALFSAPRDVKFDAANSTLYVTDAGNELIRAITVPGAVVTTIAGQYHVAATSNGVGTNATFTDPSYLAVNNTSQQLFISDYTAEVVRVLTLSSGNVAAFAGVVSNENANAKFNNPSDVAVDAAGNLYVADTQNNAIRLISPLDVVSTIAGNGEPGSTDGVSNNASFYYPQSVAVDGASNVYVADTYNHTIRKIYLTNGTWTVTTLAGSAGYAGSANGTGSAARFYSPSGVAVDGTGTNIFVSDSFNDTVRLITITTNGAVVTTIAGTIGTAGSSDGTAALFNHPAEIAVYTTASNVDYVYVADSYNQTIRLLTNKSGTTWTVTTVAGTAGVIGGGLVNGLNGVGSAAEFDYPLGVAVDGSGNVLVADTGNNRISVDAVTGFPGPVGSGLAFDLLHDLGSGPTGSGVVGGSSSGSSTTQGGGNNNNAAPAAFDPTTDPGVYNGLFASDSITLDTAGMLKGLTVTKKQTYTGTILVGGKTYSIKGSFDTNSDSYFTNKSGGFSGYLHVASGAVSGYLTFSGPDATSTLSVYRASTGTAASYTLAITPDSGAAASPTGDGYASITEKASGTDIAGALADGTTFSQSVPIDDAGNIPVFASLYGGKGAVFGVLNLTDQSGGLSWIYPGVAKSLFKTGFVASNPVTISSWTSSSANDALTNLTSLVLDSSDISVTNTATGKVKGTENATGTISTKTGVFKISVGSGDSKVTTYGVVLTNSTVNGAGYFLNSKTNGAASLTQ